MHFLNIYDVSYPVQCCILIALYSAANLSITNTEWNLLFFHIFEEIKAVLQTRKYFMLEAQDG